MAEPGPKISESVANVTTQEVLAILSNPLFEAPPGVDDSSWQTAIASVRGALGKLPNLDLTVGEGKSYISVLCRRVDEIVRSSDAVGSSEAERLIASPTVSRIRQEIAIRLQIRIRFGRAQHEDLAALIALIKKKKGKIKKKDWEELDDNHRMRSKCYAVVTPFGIETGRKQLGWKLVAEYLSELSGETVEFVDQTHCAKRRRGEMVADVGDDVGGTSVRQAAVQPPALRLPPDIDLDVLKRADVTRLAALARLRARSDTLSGTLEQQIAEIAAKLGELEAGQRRLESDLARIQADLEPYTAAVQPVRDKYARILKALHALDRRVTKLPKDRQYQGDVELAKLKLPYQHTLARQSELQEQRAAIVAKIDLLKPEKERLEELKGAIARLRAGFEELGLFKEAAAAAAEPELGLGGDEEDDDEPEDDSELALKATRDLAKWFRRLHESIRAWPEHLGWKVVREAGRVDDLIAQLERLLEKKALMLELVTDTRFSGMLDTFLLDLQGAYPEGVSAPKGGRKKDRGSIKVDRFGTLRELLRDYEEAE